MNNPEAIVIHHSLTKDGDTVDWEAIRRYHMGKGWRDIGYHFGIEMVAGELVIQQGRSVEVEGAHTKEEQMNFRSIGICVIGNFDIDVPTMEQYTLLAGLCQYLIARYGIKSIFAHRDFASYKSCPGKNFSMSNLVRMVDESWRTQAIADNWQKLDAVYWLEREVSKTENLTAGEIMAIHAKLH